MSRNLRSVFFNINGQTVITFRANLFTGDGGPLQPLLYRWFLSMLVVYLLGHGIDRSSGLPVQRVFFYFFILTATSTKRYKKGPLFVIAAAPDRPRKQTEQKNPHAALVDTSKYDTKSRECWWCLPFTNAHNLTTVTNILLQEFPRATPVRFEKKKTGHVWGKRAKNTSRPSENTSRPSETIGPDVSHAWCYNLSDWQDYAMLFEQHLR